MHMFDTHPVMMAYYGVDRLRLSTGY